MDTKFGVELGNLDDLLNRSDAGDYLFDALTAITNPKPKQGDLSKADQYIQKLAYDAKMSLLTLSIIFRCGRERG